MIETQKFYEIEECETIIRTMLDFSHNFLSLPNFKTFVIHDEKIKNKFCKIERVNKIFSETKKLKISQPPIVRFIELSKGNHLPTHNFDYSRLEMSRYTHTKFAVVIHLGGNYNGGEYFFNGNLTELKDGYGVIHSKSTKGKVNKILEGSSYYLFCHYTEFDTLNII